MFRFFNKILLCLCINTYIELFYYNDAGYFNAISFYLYSCKRTVFHNARNVNCRVMLNKSCSTSRVVHMSAQVSATGHLHKAARKKRLKCFFLARPVRSTVLARIHFCNYDGGGGFAYCRSRVRCPHLRAMRANLLIGADVADCNGCPPTLGFA